MATKPKTSNPASTGVAPPKMKKPSVLDDLTRIKGVGPVLQKKLHGMGVYNYSQIAVWKKNEVEWVDGYLNFKGRIDRDEWIPQCKAYAKEAAKGTRSSESAAPKKKSKAAAGKSSKAKSRKKPASRSASLSGGTMSAGGTAAATSAKTGAASVAAMGNRSNGSGKSVSAAPAKAAATSSSVSGLGIRTSLDTSNSKPQKGQLPYM